MKPENVIGMGSDVRIKLEKWDWMQNGFGCLADGYKMHSGQVKTRPLNYTHHIAINFPNIEQKS